jgi:hypothetical protein
MATWTGSQAVRRLSFPTKVESPSPLWTTLYCSIARPLAIEQYNAMIFRSPVNPDKITESLIQLSSPLFEIRDALVIPVPALIRYAVALLPTGLCASRLNRQGAGPP